MPLQLHSNVKSDGVLELTLAEVAMPEPKPEEVVVRVEASPVNPSDLGLLFGLADMSTAQASGSAERPVVTATVPEGMLKNLKPRLDQPLPVGNEGAGVVVAAGDSELAQSLLGKTVAILGGAMYTQYRAIKAKQCLVLPEGTTPAQGASCFVNPLTALGMVETMKLEGHTALRAHRRRLQPRADAPEASALKPTVSPLVNVVRQARSTSTCCAESDAQFVVQLERSRSSSRTLTDALVENRSATIAFDATGGGKLAEHAPHLHGSRRPIASRRRSSVATARPRLSRSTSTAASTASPDARSIVTFGMAWSIGGWLLPPFLQKHRQRRRTEASRARRGRDQDHVREPATPGKSRWPRR